MFYLLYSTQILIDLDVYLRKVSKINALVQDKSQSFHINSSQGGSSKP